MNRSTRLAAPVALLLLVGLSAPAWAQDVILFGSGSGAEDFSGYTVGSALPTSGNWASATNVTIENGASGTYAYFSSDAGTPATREAVTTQIAAGSHDHANLSFWLKYTTSLGVQDSTLMDGTLAFDEFPNSPAQDAITVQYSIDGVNWLDVRTFTSNNPNPAFAAGKNVGIKLPTGALSDNLQIRFTQSYGGVSSFASQWAIDNVQIVNPEPATWALFSLASLGLGGYVAGRRRRRAAAAKTAATA